jgi:UDP-N-acetylglucosamine--N-acetylmuramyl-(pentapeptide) pyrophosphoryl-undecaprenol N-acetylglucosamine transferase
LSFRNVLFFYNLLISMIRAGRLVDSFKPDVVVGVGGYASGPVVRAAASRGIPVLIQEQNSFAGVTNRLLARKAARICVAYEGMDKYFPQGKIVLTGNPVRQDLLDISGKREEALSFFGIREKRKVILVLGGSLGAGSINKAVSVNIDGIRESGIDLIWQTGPGGYNAAGKLLGDAGYEGIHLYDFITRMDLAYAMADLVISRAGAGTISELCLTAKPAILVPSPNVAEDHQTRNAMALVKRNAAVLVNDLDALNRLIPMALELVGDSRQLLELEKNISAMALPGAAGQIADEVLKLINHKE